MSALLNLSWKSPWFARVLAIAGGAALALSFPRTSAAGLAWIGPALIVMAARQGNRFRLGYLAGFVHYLISLSWLLHIPVRFYPILGWIALAAYLALYPAAWAWLCLRREVEGDQLKVESWRRRTSFALFGAIAWVAMEMIVSRMFTGFPWNLLGASQYQLLPLIQIAPWTGIYGVSFVVVWFSASLLNVFDSMRRNPGARHVWLQDLALPLLVVVGIYAFGLHRIRSGADAERSIRVALVQPSIPQTMIWNPAESDTRFSELMKLTEFALTNKPDLVIWPEAAVPKMVRDDEFTQRAIARLAQSNRVWMIVGSDDFAFEGTNAIYFNSSFLISPRGEFISTYHKRRLVIFGEYIPLIKWVPIVKYLTPIQEGFRAGEKPIAFDLGELGVRTSVLICFEDVFPHYAREHVAPDLDFLVNITNDGWFGESAAQWQQAASAVFRAVENGVPLVRCANNGLSCWIDRYGGLHNVYFPNSDDVYSAGFKIVSVPVQMRARHRTFYSRYGDWFGWSCVVVTGLTAGFALASKRRRLSKPPR